MQHDRASFLHATAEILKRGYTLTNRDIAEIMPYYGYSETSAHINVSSVLNPFSNRRMLAQMGVELTTLVHKSQLIYVDGNLPADELVDLDTSVAQINQSIDARTDTRWEHNPKAGQQQMFSPSQLRKISPEADPR